MGMLMDAVWVLVKSLLALLQLVVFGILSPVYFTILAIVGALNILYVMVTGDSFENIGLLIEPLVWAMHQLKVLVAAEDDFWAVPYAGM